MSSPQPDEHAPRRPLRLLLVEDSAADAELLTVALEWAGYALTTRVVSAEQALRDALTESWDIVISDYVLPGFSGMEAVRIVTETPGAPPVILVSGTVGEETAVEALREGASDYLLKDRLARLPAAIESSIERHRMAGERERISRRLVEQESLGQAVLSSIDAHIAVLDGEGRIVAVNEAWQQFAYDSDGGTVAASPVGQNYLEVCRRAIKDESAGAFAQQALEGIEAVIRGERQNFVAEYPCHGPGRPRWFSMKVTPLRGGGKTGVVVAHENVTAVMRSEAERRLNALAMEAMSEGLMVLDHRLSVVNVNDAFTRITGFEVDDVRGGYPVQWLRAGNSRALLRRIEQALHAHGEWEGEYACQRKDGEWYTEFVRVRRLSDDINALPYYVVVCTDITPMREYEERLEYLAHYDELTGLPNKRFFLDCMEEALLRARENRANVACLVLRVDEVRVVNDTLGHAAGDSLLVQIGRRMLAMPDASRACGRIGDDQFGVFIEGCGSDEDLQEAALRLHGLLLEPSGDERGVALSRVLVGGALSPGGRDDAEALLRRADVALFNATDNPAGVQLYESGMGERMQRNVDLVRQLREAVSRNELSVLYQPRYALATGELRCVEALLRWHSHTLGAVSPGEFIPLAEETGLIRDIGMWVLREAFAQLARWRRDDVLVPMVAVNLSVVQFREPRFSDRLLEVAGEAGIRPAEVELEITEGTLIDHYGDVHSELLRLREAGFSIAIDDFGTGYSSLAYLKKIAASTLKVDKAFVDDLPGDNEDFQIVAAVHAIGRALGMTVVAEGVERNEQETCLSGLGCDEVQGFLYSPPVSADEVAELLVQSFSARLL